MGVGVGGETVTGVGAYILLDVTFTLHRARVCVVCGAVVVVRALAERVSVHLVQQLQPLAHREQPARLLSLTPQPLQQNSQFDVAGSNLPSPIRFLSRLTGLGITVETGKAE